LITFLITSPVFGEEKEISTFPSREYTFVLSALENNESWLTYEIIEQILGEPDANIGSGVYIFLYTLNDGSTLIVTSQNKQSISSIELEGRRKGTQKSTIYSRGTKQVRVGND